MASINDLPAALQPAIQLGFLDREFRDPLQAKLTFRDTAERVTFTANVGESIIRTKGALMPPATSPISNRSNSSLDNGITSHYWGVEQFVLSLDQYGDGTDLNMVTSRVAIADIYLQNARKLAEQAARSVEMLAQQAYFQTFMGQNTFVTTTLGAPGTTVHVDDIRGFGISWTSTNTPTSVSPANPLAVTFVRVSNTNGYSSGAVSADTVGGTYNVVGATVDGTNVSMNAAVGGISGTLTFASNVAVADATQYCALRAAVAPQVQRPFNRASSAALGSGDGLSASLLLDAVNTLRSNNVEPNAGAGGFYRLIGPPKFFQSIFEDAMFQRFNYTRTDSDEYRRGVVGRLMDVECVMSNMVPRSYNAAGQEIYRGILIGDGALMESDFTETGYAGVYNELDSELVTIADGIAHVTRPPLDRLGQIVTQSWTYIGGFTAPTDLTTTTQTIPTSTNTAWKRAMIIETFAS